MTADVWLVSVMIVVLALAGCAGGVVPSPSPSLAATSMGDRMDDHGTDEDAGALGDPADPSDAQRTIHIITNDQLRFEPAAIEVSVGEIVTFEIENTGVVHHEFVLGDMHYQDEHEAEMQVGDMHMDEPNQLEIPAGETVTLTWHFTQPGTTLYGCHEPGHFPAGMYGTIAVNP